MKLKTFLLSIIFMMIFSCAKESETNMVVAQEEEMEDEGTVLPPVELQLIGVLTERLIAKKEESYTFANEQLISLNDKTATYENNLLSQLEQQDQTESFEYDGQGRLTRYLDDQGGDFFTRNITYQGNEIRMIQQLITPFEVETTRVTFFMDDAKRVVKEEYTNQYNEVFTAELSYDEAGNLEEAVGVANVSAFQFSYNENEVSSSYQFLKSLFGIHWKNNALIYKGRVISMIGDRWFIELANRYPTETKVIFEGGFVLTKTFTYEFHNDGNVLLRNEFNDDGKLDTRTTYEFE